MRPRRTVVRFAVSVAAAAIALAPSLAAAHTTIVLAAGQIVPGGYVNGQRVGDGPATDGTLQLSNADPIAYVLTGVCTTSSTCGSDGFQITVPARAVNQSYCKNGLRRGTYRITGNGGPTMIGEVRVSPTVVSCGH